ncbi:MAG: hydratase [Pseudomonadota bacterium]|nr:hydratase [Pseudomonadota bacterium]
MLGDKRWIAGVCAALGLAAGTAAHSQADPADWPGRFVESFETRQAITDFPATMPWPRAYRLQGALVERLMPQYGPVAGYKAALTGPGQRQRFAVEQPVWGVLLAQTLSPNGSTIDGDFGVAPFIEGDFIVRVGSAAINTAADRMDVLAQLDAVVPFLELVDLPVRSEQGMNLPGLIAGNTGARKGLLGEPVPIAASEAWMERLGAIEVILYENGREVSRGTTTALYGHPVDAVIWLRDALAEQGISLKAGDLLSLGSVAGGMHKLGRGTTIRADYHGLVDDGTVSVSGQVE